MNEKIHLSVSYTPRDRRKKRKYRNVSDISKVQMLMKRPTRSFADFKVEARS